MGMTDHEVQRTAVSYFSEEVGADGRKKPTLWDTAGPGRVAVGVLYGAGDTVEISSDPNVVILAEGLSDEDD